MALRSLSQSRLSTLLSASHHPAPPNNGPSSVKGLTKLLADNAPKSMKEQKFESYFGRKIAIAQKLFSTV